MKKLGLVAILLLCSLSARAQSFIQYNQNAGTSASFTVAYTTQNDAAGNCTIVIASWKPANGGIPTGVPTDSEGNTYVQDGAALVDGGSNSAEQFWHSCGIVGGTKSIITYHNDGGATVEVQIAELHGVDTVDQVSRTGTGTGTTATSASLTTTHAAEVVLNSAAINPASSQFFSAGDGTFTDAGGGTGGTYISQYKITSSTGSFAPTATINASDTWVSWTSSYYQSSGGGGGGGGGGATPTSHAQNPGVVQRPGSVQSPGAVQSPGKIQAPF